MLDADTTHTIFPCTFEMHLTVKFEFAIYISHMLPSWPCRLNALHVAF